MSRILIFISVLVFLVSLNFFFTTTITFARVTPEDIYQEKRAAFEKNLAAIQDPNKKQTVILADQKLKEINLTLCARFQNDLNKLSAILDEEKSRQNITKTVVAYGQGDTPFDTAAYYLNYAAEALAYQQIQDYTPNISGGNLKGGINTSTSNLKSNLITLQGKIIRAKTEINKAINDPDFRGKIIDIDEPEQNTHVEIEIT